jgi:hypothetical protein
MASQHLSDEYVEVVEAIDAVEFVENPSANLRNSQTLSGNKTQDFSSDSSPIAPPILVRSPLERFLDSFFQPANIKWMLVIGAAIVLGSSLMLVTKQWSSWPAMIKFAAVLGYTGAIYAFAEIADRRLGLKSTGNVLRGLTLLLMPVMMLGLRWVAAQESWLGIPAIIEVGILMVPATSLLFYAGRNILRHFLRGDQTTFLVCYGLLAIAGTLPRMESASLAVGFVLACWAVLTIGVAKVNRHVFWLTEEHRMPRVFGFFPILLLGAQFVMLACSKSLYACPPEWFGTCLVMFAATVLLTARSVASVFRERTGNLVRPLPWSIGLPLFTGLLLTFAGVVLSCWGVTFVGTNTTYAVVPTALLGAVLMFVVAYDTRHRAFTWLMLILVAVAYQASPTLVQGFIETLKASAASAVREDRLPLAFYGITYLPLLGLLTLASRWSHRFRREELSKPIQQFVTALAIALFLSSAFHVKAVFLVALINVVVFVGYAIAFQDRRYAYGSIIASLVATIAYVPFANQMFGHALSIAMGFTCLTVLALALYATRLIDRCIEVIPLERKSSTDWMFDAHGRQIPFAYYTGLGLLSVLAVTWALVVGVTIGSGPQPGGALVSSLLLVGLSLIIFRTREYLAGLMFALMTLACCVSFLIGNNVAPTYLLEQATTVCTIVSLVGLSIVRWSNRTESPWSRVRTVFGWDLTTGELIPRSELLAKQHQPWLGWLRCHVIALSDVATVLVVGIATFYYAPSTFIAAIDCTGSSPLAWQSALVVGWLVGCIALLQSRLAATSLATFLPLYVSATINTTMPGTLTHESLPVAMVSGAALLCWMCHLSKQLHLRDACFVSRIWLGAIALVSFVYLSVPIRIAGAIAISALLIAKGTIRVPGERIFLAIVFNLHALLFVAGLTGAHGWLLDAKTISAILPLSAILFPAFCLSGVIADQGMTKLDKVVGEAWCVLMCLFAGLSYGSALVGGVASLELQACVLAGIVIALYGAVSKAIRTQNVFYAWSCLVLMCGGLVWLWDQNLLVIGTGWSQIALILVGASCLWISRKLADYPKYGVFTSPTYWVGMISPSAVAGLAVMRAGEMLGYVGSENANLLSGLNYLALLAAAAVYFVHGLNTGKRRFYFLAAIVLNLAILMFCQANSLRDPQFYCVPIGLSILGIVELLKRELPKASHDPLRYMGALVILVSPVFGMNDSSWLHLFSLMVLCVLMILIAMGLRIRALMFTGSAFLLADLGGMILKSTIDNPMLLWVGGIGLGVSVIALAAFCENHRENLLAKIRLLSAELATWN